jgi:hypothetical protein
MWITMIKFGKVILARQRNWMKWAILPLIFFAVGFTVVGLAILRMYRRMRELSKDHRVYIPS